MTTATGRTITCLGLCSAAAVGAYGNPWAFWVIVAVGFMCVWIWEGVP